VAKITRLVLLLVVLFALASPGCGPAGGVGVSIPIPEKWVDELISKVVAWLEDTLGVKIEKGNVKIVSNGARKDTDTSGFISDFTVTVKYHNTEYTSTPKNIPCNTDGIATKEGNAKIKEAVEEIKRSIEAVR
jgi:hypothetical protein